MKTRVINSIYFSFFVVLAIVIIGCSIYSNTLHSPFYSEDFDFIVNNQAIQNVTDIQAIANSQNIPTKFITFLSFAINYQFHQYNVIGYHVVNILIHLINGLLVFWLMNLIFVTPRIRTSLIFKSHKVLSFFIALIFLTHPLQTQAINYISQRSTLLATLFYLLTLCLYVRARLLSSSSRRFFLLAGITGFLAMFTKQIALTLPFTIILFEFMFLKSTKKTCGLKDPFGVKYLIPISLFLLIIPALYLFNFEGVLAQQLISDSHGNRDQLISSSTYFLTQPRVIMTYIRLLFIPIGLNFDYDFPLSTNLYELHTLIGFLLLSIFFYLGIRLAKSKPIISFGIFWFFITSLIESSFIPSSHVIHEHRAYLPSIGFSIGLCLLTYYLFKRYRLYAVIIPCMIVGLCFVTYQRNHVWQDPTYLWADVVKKSPYKASGYTNLGIAFAKKAQYEKAVENFKMALELNPKDTIAQSNIRKIQRLQGLLTDTQVPDLDVATLGVK